MTGIRKWSARDVVEDRLLAVYDQVSCCRLTELSAKGLTTTASAKLLALIDVSTFRARWILRVAVSQSLRSMDVARVAREV